MPSDRIDRGDGARRGRRAAAWLAAVTLLVSVLVGSTAVALPVAAQEVDEPATVTTLRPLPDDAGRIIKRPNYGHEPTHAGDRGGWQQTLVLLLVVGAVAVGGGLVWRDSRRRRPGQPVAPPDRS